MTKLAVYLSAVSILLLSACASHAPQSIPPVDVRLTKNDPSSLTPMPDTWYITGVSTDARDVKFMCSDKCLPITISERKSNDGIGFIVLLDNKDIPGLLLALGSKRPQDLVGKQVTRDDQKNPALADIVKQGQECSANARINPLFEGRHWC